MENYVRRVLELFASFGSREALVGPDRRVTFDRLRADVLARAAALRDAGVKPGSAVLVMVANSVEGPILQLALHLLGCRSMWVAPVTARSEIDQFVRITAPDVFIYDPANGLGAELAAGLDVPVLCLGRGGTGPDLTAPYDGAAFDLRVVVPEPDSFLQTSGTTGTPKLVHHRQSFYEQIITLAGQFVAAGYPLLRHLSHSPMWLASGQITSLFNLFTGGVLFLRDEWDPARFLATIEAERINSTFVTPPMLYEVLDHPALDGADTSSLFMFNVGAGPASPARLRQAIARFGPVLRIVYGMSEAVVITALPGLTEDPAHPERLQSCGTAYGDVRIEIRDEDGKALPVGETGTVWVASRLSFAGYFGQPELTAETLVDGWVRTNDVGYLDEDGYLFLVDRRQDMIVTSRRSWPIFCRPIEDALTAHPKVANAAVIGVPDPVVGEVPHAFVVPLPGATIEPAELIGLVTERLSELYAPGRITFVDRLPLNRSAKIDKQALRALHAAGNVG
ncbi:AMP-binding protein [Kribbella deserti]|uniref:AMP-binding protein n=1 Tax=Kribbella deserti TaxID=1926257 RepID=A0ABV6QXR6_9ACTN